MPERAAQAGSYVAPRIPPAAAVPSEAAHASFDVGPDPSAFPVASGRPVLFVVFNGQKIAIAQDEFVIGRSRRTADLPIRDSNVSRRHAAVLFEEGAFYIVDAGSTNGVTIDGERISRRRIGHGDVYSICGYELRFLFR